MHNWKELENLEFNYNINSCYNWVNKKWIKDFVEIIAQKASKTTYGTGLIINSKNEDITNTLNNFIENNKILEILRKTEIVCSKYGKSIIYLTASNDNNNITINYLSNPFNGRVSKINEQEQVAEIWEWKGTGDTKIFRKISIDNKYIKVIDYSSDIDNRIGTTTVPEPNNLKPLKEYAWIEHNLPFFPVFEIENLPINNWVNTTFNFRPDWLPIWKIIDFYNQAVRISQVELNANRTRMEFILKPEDIKALQQLNNKYKLEDIDKDALIRVPALGNLYQTGQNDSRLTLLAGNPQFSSYIKFLDYLENQIMKGSGYSAKNDTKIDYDNKTTALFSDKDDKETAEQKRALRLPILYKIFDNILTFYNIPTHVNNKRDYSIEISDILISDLTTQIDTFSKMLDNGLVSRAEIRAKLFNISIEQAKLELKEVDKENLAYMEQFNESNNKTQEKGKTSQYNPSNDLLGNE